MCLTFASSCADACGGAGFEGACDRIGNIPVDAVPRSGGQPAKPCIKCREQALLVVRRCSCPSFKPIFTLVISARVMVWDRE
jgi:hypothetical protein